MWRGVGGRPCFLIVGRPWRSASLANSGLEARRENGLRKAVVVPKGLLLVLAGRARYHLLLADGGQLDAQVRVVVGATPSSLPSCRHPCDDSRRMRGLDRVGRDGGFGTRALDHRVVDGRHGRLRGCPAGGAWATRGQVGTFGNEPRAKART